LGIIAGVAYLSWCPVVEPFVGAVAVAVDVDADRRSGGRRGSQTLPARCTFLKLESQDSMNA
jgi:hypothetical protein